MVTLLSTPPPPLSILGVDKGGECAMASHKFTVDITAPEDGKILSGPYSGMVSMMFPYLLLMRQSQQKSSAFLVC